MPRKAYAIETLVKQVNTLWPNRSKQSDGWIGDSAHAARKSDHNPNKRGVVLAFDFTNDPAHRFSSEAFSEYLLKQQDPRLGYVISNKKIGYGPGNTRPGVWWDYNGSNPHDHHCHVSVAQDEELYDNGSPWRISTVVIVPSALEVAGFKPPMPTLAKGSKGNNVMDLQHRLNKWFQYQAMEESLKVDGDFGNRTLAAVELFQRSHGLAEDGIVGPHTWDVIKEKTK